MSPEEEASIRRRAESAEGPLGGQASWYREDVPILLGEVDRLRLLAGWYALEPCEYIGDGWSCEVATDLLPEERCGPCQARIAIGTRAAA